MGAHKTTFALLFGNRGFFPGALQAAAREGHALRRDAFCEGGGART